MKSKKILALIISLSLTAGLSAGAAIVVGAVGNANGIERAVEEKLVMDSSATVTLGATQLLRASVNSEVVRCTWTTSDPSVLTIEGNGNVVGHQLGTATVTAKYGDKEAKCAVTVALNDNVPTFEFDALDGDSVQIDIGHTLGLSGKVRFNGNTYDDIEVSYKLTAGDKTLGSISDGEFIPAKEGEATITATATWRGVTSEFLTKKIKVTVVPSTVLLINDSPILPDVEVYTVENWKGTAYKNAQTFQPTLLVNGERVTPAVSILHTDVAEYDEANGEIIGQMHGQTTAVISYQGDGVDFEERVPINVTAPVSVWDTNVEYFSALTGDLIDVDGTNLLEEVFVDDNSMLLAFQGEKELDISTGKILGVETSRTEMTTTRLTIYGKKYAYNVNVSGYTMVIKTPQDVVDAFHFDMNKSSVRDGYYFLKNDVDMTNYDVNGDGKTGDSLSSDSINMATSYSQGENNPFRGIFDGNGKAIKGLKMGHGCGLFGVLESATVKNLALTEVNMYGGYGSIFGFLAYYSTIENVYISIDYNSTDEVIAAHPELWLGKTNYFGLFGHRPATNASNSVILKDVIIEMTDGFTNNAMNGAVGLFCNDPFTPQGGTVQPNFTNVYFLVPTASNGRIVPMCQADKDSSGVRIRQTVYAANVYANIEDGTNISFDAQNNPVVDANGASKLYHYASTLQYDDVAAMKAAGITKVGNWSVNENDELVFSK